MAEQIDLTTPITFPNITNYRVRKIQLDRDQPSITITLRDNNSDKTLVHRYNGDIALTLMNQLNTANLSTNSLERRILARLISDGILVGTISGSPD